MDTELSADVFKDGTCYPYEDTPEVYENGAVMNFTGGMCGFKYQVDNLNEDGFSSKFKVMKDLASQLTVVGTTLAAAVYTLSF